MWFSRPNLIKKGQTFVEVSTNSYHKRCEKSRLQKIKNLINLVKSKEENESKKYAMDEKNFKSQVSDEARMLVICEKEHKSDEPKTQVEDKGVIINVCDEEHT